MKNNAQQASPTMRTLVVSERRLVVVKLYVLLSCAGLQCRHTFVNTKTAVSIRPQRKGSEDH